MSEKRKRVRKTTPHKINVVDTSTNEVIGRMVDVNASGLMMIAGRSYDMDAVIPLRVSIPTVAAGKDVVECRGIVRWCRPDSNPRFHRVGFEFMDIGGEDASILEEVMHKLNLVG